MVPQYKEGDEITNEHNATYRRINGDWVLIRYPDGTLAEGFGP